MSGVFAIVFLAALVGVFKPYINGAKRWHFGLGTFAAFILIGAFATPASKSGDKPDSASTTAANPVANKNDTASDSTKRFPEETPSEWTYSTEKDEMRGGETRYAQVEATKTINLDFPYGEQRGHMVVRHSPKFGFDILVGVPSGQIMCNAYSNSHISVKFDDSPIRRYGCTDASDGSNSMVFVQDAKGFLANLKKAKKTMVEAEFFQNGLQQITFNTANLKWDN